MMRVLKRLICVVGFPFVMIYVAAAWVATGRDPALMLDDFFYWGTH